MSKITVEQIGELVKQSKGKNPRITRENLQAFLRNPQSVNVKLSEEYVVSVDYGKSFEEMVLGGNYDWKNDNINSLNFPIKGKGTVNVNLELVHFNKSASSKDVLTYLEANGMRPATIEELLAFGATYPEVQREFPIICLGSFWINRFGNREVPFLCSRHGFERHLDFEWSIFAWFEGYRFLAVRK